MFFTICNCVCFRCILVTFSLCLFPCLRPGCRGVAWLGVCGQDVVEDLMQHEANGQSLVVVIVVVVLALYD